MDERALKELAPFLQHYKLSIDWHSLDEYFDRLEKQGAGVNLGTYVGATRVRQAVVGNADRAPTADELKIMEGMVEDAMLQGALGLSTALIYAPASYSRTDELIALAKVASKYGGIYASHVRNESDTEMQALEEGCGLGAKPACRWRSFTSRSRGRRTGARWRRSSA
jgi:dihydroorotase/N-acyl-D-amino-acid deacylase